MSVKRKPRKQNFNQALAEAIKSDKKRKLPRKPKIQLCNKRESKRWSFAKDGVRQSNIGLFLDCNEQFRLRMAEGLRKERHSASIDYGNLWHWLLSRAHDRRYKAKFVLDRHLTEVDSEWRADNPLALEKQRQDWEMSLVQTRVLWPLYREKFADDWSKVHWECVEQDFRVAYKREHVETFLNGIWDGVIRGRKDRLWLHEIKTKSRIDEYAIEDCLHLDWQVMLYMLAIRVEFGEYPAGVQYNVIRKPETKIKQGESMKAYARRLTDAVLKDEDHYFKRWEMTVTKEQIERWSLTQLYPLLYNMKLWAEGKTAHFINTQSLIGRFGRCEMFDVITKGDFTGVTQDHVSHLEKDR